MEGINEQISGKEPAVTKGEKFNALFAIKIIEEKYKKEEKKDKKEKSALYGSDRERIGKALSLTMELVSDPLVRKFLDSSKTVIKFGTLFEINPNFRGYFNQERRLFGVSSLQTMGKPVEDLYNQLYWHRDEWSISPKNSLERAQKDLDHFSGKSVIDSFKKAINKTKAR